MNESEQYNNFIEYFKNFIYFEGRKFDKKLEDLLNYSLKHGLSESDLELVTNCFRQNKLGVLRIRKLMKCLVPKQYISDKAVENVLKFLLRNYHNQKLIGTIKLILQWLIGLLEYKLVRNNEKINSLYELFYYFLDFPDTRVCACKLIFMLTKSADVSRFNVKQVLEIHIKYDRRKYTSALLFLFKSYRPDLVPERFPAISVHKAFGKLPNFITQRFLIAKNRIEHDNAVPTGITDIQWVSLENQHFGTRQKTILIPNMTEKNLENNSKSLFSVKNLGQLYKFLPSYEPSSVLALLNNTAGLYMLAFGDVITQSRFSFNLYYILHDAFLDRNRDVPESEKKKLLNKLVLLQNNIQEGLPVISKFIAQFLLTWDGVEYEEYIYALMEWLHFRLYEQFQYCVLNHLYDLFVSGTVKTQCNILELLANLSVNTISSNYRSKMNHAPIFHSVEEDAEFEEILEKLYKFISKICLIGLNLENCNQILLHSILELHEKICLAEEAANIQIFKVCKYTAYAALFSSNPNILMKICNFFNRFPDYLPEYLKIDFLQCLWYCMLETKDPESIFFKCDIDLFKKVIIDKRSNWENHFALVCYNRTNKISTQEEFVEYANRYYHDIFKFFLKNV